MRPAHADAAKALATIHSLIEHLTDPNADFRPSELMLIQQYLWTAQAIGQGQYAMLQQLKQTLARGLHIDASTLQLKYVELANILTPSDNDSPADIYNKARAYMRLAGEILLVHLLTEFDAGNIDRDTFRICNNALQEHLAYDFTNATLEEETFEALVAAIIILNVPALLELAIRAHIRTPGNETLADLAAGLAEINQDDPRVALLHTLFRSPASALEEEIITANQLLPRSQSAPPRIRTPDPAPIAEPLPAPEPMAPAPKLKEDAFAENFLEAINTLGAEKCNKALAGTHQLTDEDFADLLKLCKVKADSKSPPKVRAKAQTPMPKAAEVHKFLSRLNLPVSAWLRLLAKPEELDQPVIEVILDQILKKPTQQPVHEHPIWEKLLDAVKSRQGAATLQLDPADKKILDALKAHMVKYGLYLNQDPNQNKVTMLSQALDLQQPALAIYLLQNFKPVISPGMLFAAVDYTWPGSADVLDAMLQRFNSQSAKAWGRAFKKSDGTVGFFTDAAQISMAGKHSLLSHTLLVKGDYERAIILIQNDCHADIMWDAAEGLSLFQEFIRRCREQGLNDQNIQFIERLLQAHKDNTNTKALLKNMFEFYGVKKESGGVTYIPNALEIVVSTPRDAKTTPAHLVRLVNIMLKFDESLESFSKYDKMGAASILYLALRADNIEAAKAIVAHLKKTPKGQEVLLHMLTRKNKINGKTVAEYAEEKGITDLDWLTPTPAASSSPPKPRGAAPGR
jgi:hypothetical protein